MTGVISTGGETGDSFPWKQKKKKKEKDCRCNSTDTLKLSARKQNINVRECYRVWRETLRLIWLGRSV